MKNRSLVALMLVLALLLPAAAACGPSRAGAGGSNVTVALDWYPNSDHAGLYLAQDAGYFKEQGLDVKLYTPSNPDDVLKLVGTGKDTFGISYEPDVLLARAQGIPVRSVAALVQHPLNTLMTLKSSGITRPGQLARKKVGYPGIPADEAVLATMMAADGGSIDQVELVNVGFDLVPALISGRVDAIIGGYFTHEAILAEQQGHPVNVIKLEQWGVPDFYELVLVASEETIQKQPEMVQRFVHAVQQGYQAAEADHARALDVLAKNYPELDRSMEQIGIERLAPLWSSDVPAFGWQAAERWQTLAQWMESHGLIKGSVDPNAAFTNQFVAGGK